MSRQKTMNLSSNSTLTLLQIRQVLVTQGKSQMQYWHFKENIGKKLLQFISCFSIQSSQTLREKQLSLRKSKYSNLRICLIQTMEVSHSDQIKASQVMSSGNHQPSPSRGPTVISLSTRSIWKKPNSLATSNPSATVSSQKINMSLLQSLHLDYF